MVFTGFEYSNSGNGSLSDRAFLYWEYCSVQAPAEEQKQRSRLFAVTIKCQHLQFSLLTASTFTQIVYHYHKNCKLVSESCSKSNDKYGRFNKIPDVSLDNRIINYPLDESRVWCQSRICPISAVFRSARIDTFSSKLLNRLCHYFIGGRWSNRNYFLQLRCRFILESHRIQFLWLQLMIVIFQFSVISFID